MGDTHSKSFFGQNTGIIFSSSSKYDPFMFIQCIKRNPNGEWEKLSGNKAKMIKMSLEEMVLILQVLNHQKKTWSITHYYKCTVTSIQFNWEDGDSEYLWINIGDYSKMLNSAQVEILRLLLTHMADEKVIYSTQQKRKS